MPAYSLGAHTGRAVADDLAVAVEDDRDDLPGAPASEPPPGTPSPGAAHGLGGAAAAIRDSRRTGSVSCPGDRGLYATA